MIEPYSSNFRVITTNFLGVRIFTVGFSYDPHIFCIAVVTAILKYLLLFFIALDEAVVLVAVHFSMKLEKCPWDMDDPRQMQTIRGDEHQMPIVYIHTDSI